MSVIYLRHPLHGDKVACSDSEAAYDKHHGWTEYDPNQTVEIPSFLKIESDNKLKPGRKPKE